MTPEDHSNAKAAPGSATSVRSSDMEQTAVAVWKYAHAASSVIFVVQQEDGFTVTVPIVKV